MCTGDQLCLYRNKTIIYGKYYHIIPSRNKIIMIYNNKYEIVSEYIGAINSNKYLWNIIYIWSKQSLKS